MINIENTEFINTLYAHFSKEKVFKLYNDTIAEIGAFASKWNVELFINVDLKSLFQFVLYYYKNIFELERIHNVNIAGTRRIYGYMAYWFVRRHPIQLIRPCKTSDLNEKFVIQWLITSMVRESKVSYQKNRNILSEFSNNVYYHLKYCDYSAESLELMTDALYTGLICN